MWRVKWWWERHWFHVWCVVILVEGSVLIGLAL